MPKGSLYKVHQSEKPLDWHLRIQISMDIVKGLHFLHSKNILHRDIKSLNVLLTESYRAKLCDFGLAIVKKESKSIASSKSRLPVVGTTQWMAPELLQLKARYSKESDVYALGLTFWEIAARKIPYSESDVHVVATAVKSGEREDIPEGCPVKFAQIIQQCWDGDPQRRPTTEQILVLLEDIALKPIPESSNSKQQLLKVGSDPKKTASSSLSSSSDLKTSYVCVGNPGAGKSTLLNGLLGEVRFEAGLAFGTGLTQVLNISERGLGSPALASFHEH